jgi:hypothetical protein
MKSAPTSPHLEQVWRPVVGVGDGDVLPRDATIVISGNANETALSPSFADTRGTEVVAGTGEGSIGRVKARGCVAR